MKYTNKKRGFTIVELIIVIAVIGILAAVLIPTFSSLIRKAQVAADETLIKNLNTALSMDTTVSKHETMTQALEATKANGFDVEKIEARATDNKIVWDSLNDCFAYIEEGNTTPTYIPDSQPNGTAKNYQLWVIVDNGVADENFSSYFAGTGLTNAIEAKKGVDVGANEGVQSVTYTNNGTAQSVVIRTASANTAITVNAPEDTITHYGESGKQTITCGEHSFHEYGTTSEAPIISKGTYVDVTGKINKFIVSGEGVKIESPVNEQLAVVLKGDATSVTLNNSTITKPSDNNGDYVAVVEDKNATPTAGVTVSTFAELQGAIDNPNAKYVMLSKDIEITDTTKLLNITHTMTLDGNGYTISGYSERNEYNYNTLVLNYNGTQKIDVIIQNVKLISNASQENGHNAKTLEARGNVNSLTLNNVTVEANGSNNVMGLCFGGEAGDSICVNIENSKINTTNAGYPILSYLPVAMNINNSKVTGYCGVYLKGEYDGGDTSGSVIKCENSSFDCPNVHSGLSNDFGVFTLEDSNIEIILNSCSVNAMAQGDAKQALLLLSGYATNKGNVSMAINGSSTIVGDVVADEWKNGGLSIKIASTGTFLDDPTQYLANGYTATLSNGIWTVTKK